MNLKQLEYFVHVAELGSFSKASLVLDIAQPALSRQVRALETDLRETLLIRNGRGVTLTEAGQRLFEHGTAILQSVAQARDDMAVPCSNKRCTTDCEAACSLCWRRARQDRPSSP